MKYKSINQLNALLVAWAGRLMRENFDLIVGCPRSGMMVANILALHMDKPVADLESFLAGRIHQGGGRGPIAPAETFLQERRKVLVVDDSVGSGGTMQRIQALVKDAPHDIKFAAAYVRPDNVGVVDFAFEPLPRPRMFEWNWHRNAWVFARSCVDIDGVLCRDPSGKENDDGPRYAKFVREATPLYLTRKTPINMLVTCRLEKYRAATEDWLKRNGIVYEQLVMMPFKTPAERHKAGHGRWKAGVYNKTKNVLFIESSLRQSKDIWAHTKRPVFCIENRQMFAQ